jgi:hypothetical protein
VARYLEGGYNGLMLSGLGDPPRDLDFVLDLPGLRSLYVHARIAHDTAAFACPTLESLTLVTASRRRIPDGTHQPAMRTLMLSWRPGLDVGTYWPALQWLRMPQHEGDCRWLGRCPELGHLQLEGRRKPSTLEGLEACPQLHTLRTVNFPVRDTTPLSGLTKLQDVRLLSRRPAPPHQLIDLRDLEHAPLRSLWLSSPLVLRGLENLGRHERLGDARVTDHVWSDAERAIIATLPKHMEKKLLKDA